MIVLLLLGHIWTSPTVATLTSADQPLVWQVRFELDSYGAERRKLRLLGPESSTSLESHLQNLFNVSHNDLARLVESHRAVQKTRSKLLRALE